MPKKSKKKKDPLRPKFWKPITIDKDFEATYYTSAMDKRIRKEREEDRRSSGSSGSER